MSNIFKQFTKIYSVDKTLRFRLKPVGKTDKNIKNKRLLQTDEKLAEKYKQAKKVIDEYYKNFIDGKLDSFSFNKDDLEEFAETYCKLKNNREDDKLKIKLAEIQDKLRKEFNDANKPIGEIIKNVSKWLDNNPTIKIEGIQDPKGIIKDFIGWATYFTGFNENRKNIFTGKDNSGSIGYRLVHENLPRFLDNIDRYKEAKKLGVNFSNFKFHLDKIFTLVGFNQCITQNGIDLYNLIIGGRNQKNNTKDQGINEKVNLHEQKHPSKAKLIRKCQLEKLYKQILSDHNTDYFRFEAIQNDSELCELISKLSGLKDIEGEVKKCLDALKGADDDKIYINNRSIEDISKRLFGKWDIIKNCLEYYADKVKFHTPDGKQVTKKLSSKRENWLKQSYFSFDDIHNALKEYFQEYTDDDLKEQKITIKEPLFNHFANLSVKKKDERIIKIFEEIQKTYENVLPVLKKYKDVDKEELRSKESEVEKIKHYLDSLMELLHFLRPLNFQEKRTEAYEKDGGFYNSKFDELYTKISDIIPIYDKTRNYLTKKPFSVEKYKLNFDNQQLGNGWDKNKEKDNACVIFIKDNRYYLGIMDKHNGILFDEDKSKKPNNREYYKKMVYKQVADPSKDIQNLIKINGQFERKTKQLDELKMKNIPEIYRIRKLKSYLSKDQNFKKEDLHTFINYYKEAAESYWDWCNFNFHPTKQYETFKDFTDHIKKQAYKITFVDISSDYINKLVEDGKLYLFEIYSKDFSPYSKGKPNLHTLYWKTLFDNDNLNNVVYKLNGKANIFHRKASIHYSDKIWQKGHHVNDPKKKQRYKIIKDMRYSQDSYFLHVSITCNFGNGKASKFNDKVNKVLKVNKGVNIIGIDRGERHLAYYTVINQKGKILKNRDENYLQGSFNNPFDDKDYHKLLDQREIERDKARKSWKTIGKIKDLKEGYLSQVIHKITNLMINYNAIVVFENLNSGFKKGRFKIEKQVYQKLEKMLIDKLNYLVFKDSDTNKIGGLMNALQLTAPLKSFRKLGKQTDFIFYVHPNYTSNVCPVTGFVDLLRPKYKTIKESQDFFKKFKKICFNKNEEYFEFHFNYNEFTKKAGGSKSDWVVYSHGERLENAKEKSGQWKTQEIDLTKCIKKLFREYSINLKSGKCLIEQIIQQNDSNFFKSLIRFLKLTLQMRNSRIKKDEDWITSPVKDKNGNFFDSRNADDFMPKNADANGAYHIGLKGLMMLEQLCKDKKPYFNNKNKDWFKFIQDRLST